MELSRKVTKKKNLIKNKITQYKSLGVYSHYTHNVELNEFYQNICTVGLGKQSEQKSLGVYSHYINLIEFVEFYQNICMVNLGKQVYFKFSKDKIYKKFQQIKKSLNRNLLGFITTIQI
ncbi:hypothetical protein PPERSA_00351 [Pseudocohnilembus persalinus]|uniref:Uncharacterized protein n=1 Tax=Pseudocohnilembus persalinus TaxID=266149 RepID=A0A0V0QYP8_PSEPJ|nr:hypothetical protein PPERSA_00351 [Pseudocohnilembus persalinus]|eukprot:KRX07194.1 hypothetical protein PPERSA_00351 [Pseudocohnilembus persalinus]